MSQKRQPGAEEDDKSDEKRQKVPALKGVVLEALKMNRLQNLLTALEPLVRRVVREEIEEALKNHLASMTRQCTKQIYSSTSGNTSRNLQLQFRNRLSLPIFTGTRIEGEDSSPLNIQLVDCLTDQIVDSGLESSMKIEIVVLEGDFEGEENWSSDDFKNNIVREREGKRSLLTGDVWLDLNEGIGVVGEISFTDNSSWTRSRKFRLGARVVDGCFHGVRVREAMTEPFMVKDHRGELYKKHHPPVLLDEVWRLEKIGKDGAFHKRLSSENINTVKDFLTLLSVDAPKLRNILGSGMSAKMWEVTIEHARTCVLPDKMYVFANRSMASSTGNCVVFNIVGDVMGLLSQQQFISAKDLSENEKAEAQSLVMLALNNWPDVVEYNDASSTSSYPNALPNPIASMHDNIFANNFGPTTVSSDIFIESENIFAMQAALPPHSPLLLGECVDSLRHYYDSELLSQGIIGEFGSPADDIGTAVTAFLTRSAAARDKANTVWGTLVFVLRWRCSIKKIVATRRRRRNQKATCV